MSVDEFKAKFPRATKSPPYGTNREVAERDDWSPDRFGVVNILSITSGITSTTEDDYAPQLNGAEIRQALFVDNRLAHFRIGYRDDAVKWDGLAQFVVKTSETLGLPLASWEPKDNVAQSFFGTTYDHDIDVGGFVNEEMYLACDDIDVVAGFLDGKRYDGGRTPFLQMDDLKAVRAVAERENTWESEEKSKKAREEEQKREAFKP